MATPAKQQTSGTHCPECEQFVEDCVVDGVRSWTSTEVCRRCLHRLGMVECYWCASLLLARWPHELQLVDGAEQTVCRDCYRDHSRPENTQAK
jgi:hypothetical protein